MYTILFGPVACQTSTKICMLSISALLTCKASSEFSSLVFSCCPQGVFSSLWTEQIYFRSAAARYVSMCCLVKPYLQLDGTVLLDSCPCPGLQTQGGINLLSEEFWLCSHRRWYAFLQATIEVFLLDVWSVKTIYINNTFGFCSHR